MAIVDCRGVVVATNAAWELQASPATVMLSVPVGSDLVSSYRRLADTSADPGGLVAKGARAVLDGELERWHDDVVGPIGANEWFSVEVAGIIGGAVVSITEITERVVAERERVHQSTHDPLTGLPNRALLADRLACALMPARRRRSGLAVLMVDLDWFNVVNASVGHQVGDELIGVIGARLAGLAGDDCTVARIAGDRFVIAIEGSTPAHDVVALAERVGAVVAEPIRLSEKREVQLTASIGIAVANASHRRPDDLLRDADAAVHRAKELGRARYEVADEELRRRLRHRLETKQDLRLAIDRDELRVDFQPEISLRTGQVLGAEALLRWHHSERGTLLPNEFILLAEETGLIVAIGEWVLREACRQAASWDVRDDSGNKVPLFVGVNLSARQLADPGLIDSVASALAESGLPPGQLCLEITESAVVESFDAAASTVTALRDMGVMVALDDFGTGHSSLSYLCRLPVDIVKIDRSFVQRVGSGRTERTIVEAVVRLAHALGLQVVAEGVEDTEQARLLLELGCAIGQGFDLGRPGPAAGVLDLARRGLRRSA
ncbi:MAG: putative bifunctional diguanylate cyclase/phosphodiesterase [Acidimicrobiia bacterium]